MKIPTIISNNKKPILTIVTLSLICYYWYYRGKQQTTIASLPYDNGSVSLTATPAYLSMTAGQIHDDITGLNFLGHNTDIYTNALTLSDTDFTALYNTYNVLNQNKGASGTMTQDITDESAAFQPVWSEVKTLFLSRCHKLNLR